MKDRIEKKGFTHLIPGDRFELKMVFELRIVSDEYLIPDVELQMAINHFVRKWIYENYKVK